MVPPFLPYIILFLLGAGIGSFLNVCISRIPEKNSIVFPPSICANCGKKIRPINNIPIFSFLILKGKCKYCSDKIPIHHLIVEMVTPLLFVFLYIVSDHKFSLIFFKFVIFASFSIIIFFIDLKHKLIPDVLSLPMIAVGLGLSFFSNSGTSYVSSLVGAGFGFLLFWLIAYFFLLIRKKEGLGGGDVKLIAAIGAFVGFSGILFVILFSSLIAIVIIFIFQRDKNKYFPYGPFLILSSLFYIFFGESIIHYYLHFF